MRHKLVVYWRKATFYVVEELVFSSRRKVDLQVRCSCAAILAYSNLCDFLAIVGFKDLGCGIDAEIYSNPTNVSLWEHETIR